jgi:hypothetical protein
MTSPAIKVQQCAKDIGAGRFSQADHHKPAAPFIRYPQRQWDRAPGQTLIPKLRGLNPVEDRRGPADWLRRCAFPSHCIFKRTDPHCAEFGL